MKLCPFVNFIMEIMSLHYSEAVQYIFTKLDTNIKFICFTSDEYDLYFFTVANRGCFDNLGLNFFQKRSGMHRFCLTLRYESTHVK